jgi:hypothetical protein
MIRSAEHANLSIRGRLLIWIDELVWHKRTPQKQNMSHERSNLILSFLLLSRENWL